MKVLIMEQERIFTESLSNFMGHYHDWDVFTAHTRKQGVSLFEAIPFDIILCGERLPDGTGLEILKEWVKERPRTKFVLMTAHSDEGLRREAREAGIQGYLEKPFDLGQLEEAIGLGLGR